jgi:serine/threonine protein kinase
VPNDEEEPRVRAISAAEAADTASELLRGAKSDDERLVGETLDGRYTILHKLGHGGMGIVYAAKHAVIERPLAIKVLRRKAMRDEATVRRFVQEAKAASRIGHPNIVDVTDFGTTPDGLTYSVMEFVDGTTLAKRIKESAPFAPERTVRIAAQIARALGAAHDKGIVHRDLKPENVFLTNRDGRPDFVKIVDFGIAKVQPAEGAPGGPKLTLAGSVFGTPEYMAPEQARGSGETDHRVDIYALGVILYEMLVGKVPIKGTSAMQTIAKQIMDPITPLRTAYPQLAVPAALETIVMRALAKNRYERFPTMAELLAVLERVGGELAAAAAPTISPALPPDAPEVPAEAAEPVAPAGRKKPPTRPAHEPEFVDRPLTLHHALEEPPAERPGSARWPYALLAVAVVAAAVAVVVVVSHSRRQDRDAPAVAEATRDAGRTRDSARMEFADDPVGPLADAAVALAALGDAAVVAHVPADHARTAVARHPATFTIEVLTQPGDAEVYIDGHHRGPGGVRIEEAWGKTLTIECKAPHFYGRKAIVFDSTATSAYCVATRIPMCVEGLKNPYDLCEQPDGSSDQLVTKPSP